MVNANDVPLQAMTGTLEFLSTARPVGFAHETAAAGTTPTGEAWAPRKADGARALANATAGVSAVAVGAVAPAAAPPPTAPGAEGA